MLGAGAIDAANGPTDHDGVPHPNPPSIGAYEHAGSPSTPSNAFSFGKVKDNKKNGTATILVNVPGAGTLSGSGAGVVVLRHPQPLSKQVSGAGG